MSRQHTDVRIGIIAALALTLAGCAAIDPFERPGVWQPVGVNDLNRELQVARPTDLVLGRGTTDADGVAAAAAVDRLQKDRVKALPQMELAPVGGSSGGGSSGSGS